MYGLLFVAPMLFAFQSAIFKQYGLKCDTSTGGNAVFAFAYYMFSALIAIPLVFLYTYSVESMLYGLGFGVIFYVFITLYSASLREGPLGVTAFSYSSSMLVTMILSIVFFKEPITLWLVVGVILLFVALYFINFSEQHSKRSTLSKKWLFLTLIGLIANGLLVFWSKYFSMEVPDANYGQYLLTGYVVCLIASGTRFVSNSTREELKDYRFSWVVVVMAILIGLTNIAGNGLVAYLGKTIPGSIIGPVNNGLAVLISILISRFYFKEQMNQKTVLGFVIGIIAIVLISL